MTATAERRRTIRELLQEQPVTSQAELLALLQERGVEATQPVLSRDLRALSVAKEAGLYKLTERVTKLHELRALLREARMAGANLVVVQCEPGAASAVARALEAEGLEGLVGSVAGDDTVFVAVESRRHGERVLERVASLLE